MKKIGLLGCGAMGTRIALAIDGGSINARLTHIFDQSMERAKLLAGMLEKKPEIAGNSHLLSSNDTDLIVEAASQQAVREAALGIIQNRKDLMIMSVGALLDGAVLDVLADACREFGRTIYLPSGAIAGLDGLKAARGEIDSLSLTTTKHPDSLRGAPFFAGSGVDIDSIQQSTIIFEGTAAEAVGQFPANINVAALISLACPGKGLRVRIVADPGTSHNTHHIRAAGRFGEMSFTVRNIPDAGNPRTSRLAILSAIERLRAICAGGVETGT